MRSKPFKIFGVGINDYAHAVVKHSQTRNGDLTGRKIIWKCNFYETWVNMLRRGFSEKCKSRQPTYKDVSVCQEWLYFSTFREWMACQDWVGKNLDKDILIPGNRIYSPTTCVFVDKKINNFLTDRRNHSGKYKIGISLYRGGKFIAACNNPFTLEKEWLGSYATEDEAHEAWRIRKLEHAKALASTLGDKRIGIALIKRYENYQHPCDEA